MPRHAHMADSGPPLRRPLVDPPGLHAAVRPRAVRRAGARGRARSSSCTSRFVYGAGPRAPRATRVDEALLPLRAPAAAGGPRAPAPRKLPQHVPGHAALRRARRAGRRRPLPVADGARRSTAACSRRGRPRRAHRPLRRCRASRGRGQSRAQRRAVRPRRRGRRPLRARRGPAAPASCGVDPARVHVIPHGAFDYLTRAAATAQPLPPELAGTPEDAGRPLLRAAAPVQGHRRRCSRRCGGSRTPSCGSSALPRMDIDAAASAARAGRRALRRRASSRDAELPAFFARADLVVAALPRDRPVGRALHRARLRQADACSATSAASPSSPSTGAARLVPPGDPDALRAALRELLGDAAARARLGGAAARAAAGRYAWDAIAARTSPSTRYCVTIARDESARRPSSGCSRRRCSSTPRSATRWCSRARTGCAAPRRPRRPGARARRRAAASR